MRPLEKLVGNCVWTEFLLDR